MNSETLPHLNTARAQAKRLGLAPCGLIKGQKMKWLKAFDTSAKPIDRAALIAALKSLGYDATVGHHGNQIDIRVA